MLFPSCQSAVKAYIREYASKIKKSKILDVGCGDGEYTSLFCCNNNKVFGLDIKERVIPEFKKFQFVKGNAENLPFPDESFDLIISFDVLEHISDDQKAIKEMYRVLKRRGKVFLETPNRERLSWWLLFLIGKKRIYPLKLGENCIHLREYTRVEIEEKFKEANFKRVKIIPFWLGLRGGWFDKGIVVLPKFLEKICQCYFLKAEK